MAVLRSFLIFESKGGGASEESVDKKRRLCRARHRGQLVIRDLSAIHRATRILVVFDAIVLE